MKKFIPVIYILTFFAFAACEKNDVSPQKSEGTLKWRGIYRCIDMVNDSSGDAQPQTNINVVSETKDSIMISAVGQSFGYSYFNNVLAQIDTNLNIVFRGAYINGSIAYLNTRGWRWSISGHVHDLLSASFILNSDNSITLKYSEIEHGIESGKPSHQGAIKSYTGHFRK